MTWLEYHELTKHSAESLRRTQHYLDWANMPNPFRHYEGVPVVDLPADPPTPQISTLELLEGKTGNTLARDGAEFPFAVDVLFKPQLARPNESPPPEQSTLCASIPLPVISIQPNFTSAPEGLVDWSDGLYHYRPSIPPWQNNVPSEILGRNLSTTLPTHFRSDQYCLREAWKYRDRPIGIAYTTRTCLAGSHACGSISRKRELCYWAFFWMTGWRNRVSSVRMSGPCNRRASRPSIPVTTS